MRRYRPIAEEAEGAEGAEGADAEGAEAEEAEGAEHGSRAECAEGRGARRLMDGPSRHSELKRACEILKKASERQCPAFGGWAAQRAAPDRAGRGSQTAVRQ
jgi:hypothetical protein